MPEEDADLGEKVLGWVRDILDVALTVGVSIILLKLLLGADMLVPLVVVTSGSMIHEPGDNSWNTWMEERGIRDEAIRGFPLTGGFNIGDMMIVKYPDANLGDVVIYERDLDHVFFAQHDPIIHRVVGVAYIEDGKYVSSDGSLDCMSGRRMQEFADLVESCRQNMDECPYPAIPGEKTYRFMMTKGDNNDYSDQCGLNKASTIAYPVNEAQILGRGWIRLPYLGWLKIIPTCVLRLFGIGSCPLMF
ncbi:MAG TPA: hypothetical protein ENN13_04915 [Candidatus Altiarchaeales archaeon]|nr:hypothetical protein [Candidatus Altiarchaeales archaeon]